MNDGSFQPDWISPPGETIATILQQQQISLERFAELMGYSTERTSWLLSGRRAITPSVAKSLEHAIGGTAKFWMSREQYYRDDIARLQGKGSIAAAKMWLSELPVQDMTKSGWISSETSTEKKVEACLKFFAVPNVSAWRSRYGGVLSAVAFRTSLTFESEPGAVLAWLRYGHIRSEQIVCKSWNANTFKERISDIRKLTRNKDPRSFIPALTKICADCGVALVIARAPSGCRASGATQFISSKKAMILLSFRYLSDDQFWFTFFHEAGHLILHSDKALFLEDGSDVTSKEEQEANRFSETILIPRHFRDDLAMLHPAQHDIMKFAVKLGISRGIVVGQLQHMKRIEPTQFNWLKRRFKLEEIN